MMRMENFIEKGINRRLRVPTELNFGMNMEDVTVKGNNRRLRVSTGLDVGLIMESFIDTEDLRV